VRVTLQRDEKNRGSRRLWLEIDPPSSLLDARRTRARQQAECDSLNAELKTYGKADATAERKLEAARALAGLLNVKLPEPSGGGEDANDKTSARRKLEAAVEKQIVEPARKRRDKLQADLKRNRQTQATADAEFDRKAGDLRARANSISAVLTRSVDAEVEAVCVILGEPEMTDEAPAAAQPANGQPANGKPASDKPQ
jgi:hypothetical protein